MGLARLAKLAFDGADLRPLRQGLRDRAASGTAGAAALMDLATIEQICGDVAQGVACQAAALGLRRRFHAPIATQAPTLRLLALAAPGDIGANAPLEFLLEDGDVALDTLYVVPGRVNPAMLPDCDLAIVAVGEADANRAVLDEIAALVTTWPVPVLNDPVRVPLLARDRLPIVLAGVPGLVVPATARVERAAAAALAAGTSELAQILPGARFPLIARPIDSHAGNGLERIADRAALAAYLARRPEPQFFIAPFVDYSGPDHCFRKYRVAFIDGRPYACHMAIADHWMIHYLNADMRASATKRAEEAAFIAGFDSGFARRHEAALKAIATTLRLDYFAIDCAETRDGALLLFEADIAMIVHAMDPPEIYPYKGPQMRKVFAAFRAMLRRRAGLPE